MAPRDTMDYRDRLTAEMRFSSVWRKELPRYDGPTCDRILGEIAPPSGFMVAYKVVAKHHCLSRWLTNGSVEPDISVLAYPPTEGWPFPEHYLTGSIGRSHNGYCVTYCPGKTSFPLVTGSKLFAYSSFGSACESMCYGHSLYRCFVLDDSEYHPRYAVPAFDHKEHIPLLSFWKDRIIPPDNDTYDLENIVLADELILMDRLI